MLRVLLIVSQRVLPAILALFVFGACALEPQQQALPQEVVMSEGQSIRITNPNGTVLIAWEEPTARRFVFQDLEWVEATSARESRWYGALGVYSPGVTQFRSDGDVRRITYGEALRDFESEAKAEGFLNKNWNKNAMKYVWNEKGLVGGLSQTEHRMQLSVHLWRITVNGEVPEYCKQTVSTWGKIAFE